MYPYGRGGGYGQRMGGFTQARVFMVNGLVAKDKELVVLTLPLDCMARGVTVNRSQLKVEALVVVPLRAIIVNGSLASVEEHLVVAFKVA